MAQDCDNGLKIDPLWLNDKKMHILKDLAQDYALTFPFTNSVWDSLRKGEIRGICNVGSTYSLEYWACRGFDYLHPLHFSTLHSEPVYGCDRAVRLLILTTDSTSLIWDLTIQLFAFLHQLMDLLLLPLSKTVHLIGMFRSEQSSSFSNIDIALTLSLNVIVTHRFTRKYWFICTLKWFHLII